MMFMSAEVDRRTLGLDGTRKLCMLIFYQLHLMVEIHAAFRSSDDVED